MTRGFNQRDQIDPIIGQRLAFSRQPSQRGQCAAHTGGDDRNTGTAGSGENERGNQSEHGKRP